MRKHLFVYLIFLLWNSSESFATDQRLLDSMKTILATSKDPLTRLNALYTLSFEYGFIEPRTGIKYGKECLELAKKINHEGFQLNAYNGMGNCYETLARFDSARWCHQQTYEIAKRKKSRRNMAATISNIANCYKEEGDYRNALSYYLKALQLVENEEEYNPRIHFYLGEIFLKTGDIEEAERHSRIGIKACDKTGFEYVGANFSINLAKCYAAKGKSDSAIIILADAIKRLKQNTDQLSICIGLNALGEVYIQRKDFPAALPLFLEELTIQQKMNNKNGICVASLNCAYCYAKLPFPNKTIISHYIDLVQSNLPAIRHNHDALLNAYKKLSQIYEACGNYPEAYSSFKNYSLLNDSLLNNEKFYQLNELQTKYNTEKKEKQIQLQKTALQQQKTTIEKNRLQLLATIALLLAVVLFALIFYIRFKSRQKIKLLLEIQKQEKLREQAILEKETEERARIAKDIHDELGSGVSKIFLLTEYSIQLSGENNLLKENLKTISRTAGTLAENMRDLVWTLNPENSTLDNLIARINEYSNEFLEDLPVQSTFDITMEVPQVKIPQKAQRNLFLTFKEALNNAIKHASCTKILIEVRIENNKLIIQVKDNGSGFDMENPRKNGNGLRNMESRIREIGGIFEIQSALQGGTRVIIQFPFPRI